MAMDFSMFVARARTRIVSISRRQNIHWYIFILFSSSAERTQKRDVKHLRRIFHNYRNYVSMKMKSELRSTELARCRLKKNIN